MRQVFSSQRIETVEGVARMLTEAGIPVGAADPIPVAERIDGKGAEECNV